MSAIVVASAKGGVGKSSFCVGVGKMLAAHSHKTLLVDMDIGVRSLDILLGTAEKTVYNWGDILKGNCDSKKALLEVSENLCLLPAPVDFSDEYSAETMAGIIKKYSESFEFILLDAPAGLESGFKMSAECADRCIIIATPDPVSIRAASCAAQNVRAVGIDDIRLVLNRFNKKTSKGICVDDIIDTVSARLLGIIPESAEIGASVNGKKIPYDCNGNLAFVRIAGRLCGENIPLRVKNL